MHKKFFTKPTIPVILEFEKISRIIYVRRFENNLFRIRNNTYEKSTRFYTFSYFVYRSEEQIP